MSVCLSLSAVSIKSSMETSYVYSAKKSQLLIKCIWKGKGAERGDNSEIKGEKGLTLPDIKNLLSTLSIKTWEKREFMGGVWGSRERGKLANNGMKESLEINSLYEKNLIHNRASITDQ